MKLSRITKHFSSLLSISVYVVLSKGGETYGYSAVGYATAGTATGLALFFAVRELLAKRKTRGFGFLFLLSLVWLLFSS